jgi:phosphatidylglycerophosphate synthase
MSPAAAAAPAALGAAICLVSAWLMSWVIGLSDAYIVVSVVACTAMMAVALAGIRSHHPYERVGSANLITGSRVVMTALIAGAITQAPTAALTWTLVAIAIGAAVLDGFDGWAARRHGMSSVFGARFDMEVDAVLILVLAALAWRFGKAGAWVLASGLMRYAFVAAAWVWPWLDAPLPPSRRRQTVCVWQIGVLIGTIAPIIRPPLSVIIAAAALLALSWSFAVDIVYLASARSRQKAKG